MKIIKTHGFYFLLLFIPISFLLLKGLDHTWLWQDEGHNATLAERILKFGYPKVWDGQNLIAAMNGLDFNQDYALTWDGWFPYYLTAGFFWVFGKTTFVARLPFVLIALLTLPLCYFLIRRLLNNRSLAFWSTAVMATSMTFLLHSRQSRYYSLLPFSTLLTLWGMTTLSSWRGILLITLGLTLLYHSNLLAFTLTLLLLFLTPLFFKIDRHKMKRFFISLLITFVLTAPHFFYTRLWEKNSGFQSEFNWQTYVTELFGNSVLLNKFYIPFFLLGMGILLSKKLLKKEERPYFWMSILLIFFSLIFIPIKFYSASRYLYFLIPFTAFLTALILLGILRKQKIIGILAFLLFFFTHAFEYLSLKPFLPLLKRESPYKGYKVYQKFDDEEGPSTMWDMEAYQTLHEPTFWERLLKLDYRSYLHEIFYPFQDGLQEVLEFLRTHQKEGDRIYLNVGQFPLLFYAPDVGLACTLTAPPPIMNPQDPIASHQWEVEAITWFIPRVFWQMKGPHLTEEEFLDLAKEKGWKIKKHELKTPLVDWEGNWPYWYRLYRIKQREFPLLRKDPTVIYQVIH